MKTKLEYKQFFIIHLFFKVCNYIKINLYNNKMSKTFLKNIRELSESNEMENIIDERILVEKEERDEQDIRCICNKYIKHVS